MDAFADRSVGEEETLELVNTLVETGNLHPLIRRLRSAEVGPERARDALLVLGDLDLELLVQLALDSLIHQFVEDPGIAHQPRRESRGDLGPPGGSTPD
jgi:hypothetical protein